jgi:hypothetical protein
MEQVVYMEETTRNHAAAEKAEGADYAESAFAFTERTSPVRKITDSLPVTDEQLEDVAGMGGYINGRLTFGVRQRLDSQSLVGDAAGSNLRGIKNVVGIQVQAKGVDPVMDAFFKAMVKVRVTGRAVPTHHLIHPTDWQGIRLTRTADGVYILGAPTDAGPERLWGLPVVQQDADAAGTGHVGSFQPAYISLFEKRGSTSRSATSVRSSRRASAPSAPTCVWRWSSSVQRPSARSPGSKLIQADPRRARAAWSGSGAGADQRSILAPGLIRPATTSPVRSVQGEHYMTLEGFLGPARQRAHSGRRDRRPRGARQSRARRHAAGGPADHRRRAAGTGQPYRRILDQGRRFGRHHQHHDRHDGQVPVRRLGEGAG